MTRAPLPLRFLSAALSIVEVAAVVVVGLVIVVRGLAHGARPADDMDDDHDEPGRACCGPAAFDARGATACPHANVRRDLGRPDFARCEDCGATDFPATPEAAGACPACGEYGDCECVPAGPRPHCVMWVVLPGGRTIGMSPFGDPMTGGEA